jgi:carbamoyltransferase
VLEEDALIHFTGKKASSPYMTVNYEVKEEQQMPSISHINKTARIQTVNQNDNALFYEYLQELKKKIGLGVSINTSFNRNQEPIIHSPIDAVSAFYGSGIDALLIGDFLIQK